MITKLKRNSDLLCSKCGKQRKLVNTVCKKCDTTKGGMLLTVHMNGGRNKACPCGSGKKSKRCCNLAARVDLVMKSDTGETVLVPQDTPWQVKLAHEMASVPEEVTSDSVEVVDVDAEKTAAAAALDEVSMEELTICFQNALSGTKSEVLSNT